MRKLYLILFLLVISVMSFAQNQRKALVEVFTNSHCPLCPAAHNTLDNYLMNSPNSGNINYIYYHMIYPYSTDQLYIQSAEGSAARHTFYNPVAATPRGFFDGAIQGSTSGWGSSLDARIMMTSPLTISLSGTRDENEFNISAEVTRTGDISDSDLNIYFVVAEDVFYAGNNGIQNHKHVMRKILPTTTGTPFTINPSETKTVGQNIPLEALWDVDSLHVMVFIQSNTSKMVYQSEMISYNQLTVTEVDDVIDVPSGFILEQNYPNPFNPNTKIRYTVASNVTGQMSKVVLKVYNLLGNEVATLVDEFKSAGSYEVEFQSAVNSQQLASGVYFYKLQAGSFVETRKMVFMK